MHVYPAIRFSFSQWSQAILLCFDFLVLNLAASGLIALRCLLLCVGGWILQKKTLGAMNKRQKYGKLCILCLLLRLLRCLSKSCESVNGKNADELRWYDICKAFLLLSIQQHHYYLFASMYCLTSSIVGQFLSFSLSLVLN